MQVVRGSFPARVPQPRRRDHPVPPAAARGHGRDRRHPVQAARRLLEDRKITLALDAKGRQWLADKGYDPAYGARPLKRVIQKKVQDPLAQLLLAGEIGDGATVKIGAAQGELTINGKPVGGEERRPRRRNADRRAVPEVVTRHARPRRERGRLERRMRQAAPDDFGSRKLPAMTSNVVARFVGGSPMAVLSAADRRFVRGRAHSRDARLRSGSLFDEAVRAVRHIVEFGLTDVRQIGRILLTGAMVVVPVWIVLRLLDAGRTR